MFRFWFNKPKIVTELSGSEIVVTMPGTSYRIIYTHMGKGQLVANSFSTAKGTGASTIAFPRFLALVWAVANEKARELGWIATP